MRALCRSYDVRMSTVGAAEALTMVAEGAVVVDVRSAAGFAQSALPGSVSLPFDSISAGALPVVGNDAVLLVVCEVGGVSELAALYLAAAGFTSVHSVRGGLAALRAATTRTAVAD